MIEALAMILLIAFFLMAFACWYVILKRLKKARIVLTISTTLLAIGLLISIVLSYWIFILNFGYMFFLNIVLFKCME